MINEKEKNGKKNKTNSPLISDTAKRSLNKMFVIAKNLSTIIYDFIICPYKFPFNK